MAKEIKELFVTVNFHNASKDNFESDNYNYWLKTSKEVKKGSYIILNDNSNWDALKICKVVAVEERKEGKTYEKALTKALIGFADVQDYFGAKERKRTIKNLLKTMEERFKESEKMAMYRKLAETDATMQNYINQLDALGYDVEEDLGKDSNNKKTLAEEYDY